MRLARLIVWWWLVAWLLAPGAASSTSQGVAATDLRMQSEIELFEDVSGEADFDSVRHRAAFRPLDASAANFGFTASAFWLRFRLQNGADVAGERVLRLGYPPIDYVDVWVEQEHDRFLHYRSGDRRPFDERPIAHRDTLVPLLVPAKSQRWTYVRLASDGAMNIDLQVLDYSVLVAQAAVEQLALGFFYGGVTVLLLYNLFIFLVVRDRAFAYYVVYAGCYGLYFAVHNGLAFQFLWPNSPDWANRSLIVLLALSLVFGLQFSRRFLHSAEHSPRLDRIAGGLQWLSVLGLLAGLWLPYAQMIVPMALQTVLVTLLILLLGATAVLQRYRPARYFMLAWTALLLGVLVYMFKTFGWLPHTVLTQNAFQAGALLEMVLLSLALGARMSELQRQTLTDPLTKLANRRYFDRQLELALAQVQRGATALLVIDIDHFKQLNDRHGHVVGDQVLVGIARLLAAQVPRSASVCRYGGEEFAVILPTSSYTDALQVADALRAAVAAAPIAGHALSVSIGVACTEEGHFGGAEDFFHAADSALYQAKRAGRNRVARYAETAPV